MKPLPHTHSCFVCGESNPFGLRLRFETDGRVVQTRFVPRAEHIGFKGVVHGGILATVLDEIMVWACAVPTRKFAYCAELTVRYRHPLAPGETVVVTSELVVNRKDRIYEAKASARNVANVILAEATGKYRPVKAADAAEMAQDFVGDPAWLLAKPG
ncbi:MAG: PaaI family thioesterase [Verrucomicrobia bacterium]|nr:PaaI family thioesterase [Verrucomicrobiota bacterium]